MVQVLYNPLSNNGKGGEAVEKLTPLFPDKKVSFSDITKIDGMKNFISGLDKDDKLIITGGDGTVNHFINDLDGECPERDIFYYPMGSGNDFFNDIKEKAKDGFVRLNEYLKDLPVITVKGRTSFFLNGIGYGIDGYCCEEGDRQRARSSKKINYTAIALKGLLFFYHPTNAAITVDGKEHKFGRVFLAPTMNGRFFGGGMMIAPEQDRLNKERTVTVSVAHDTNRFNILRVFPSIFKGAHVKYKKIFASFVGKDITVKFDRPTALQIDGETVTGVSEYSVKAGKLMKEREKPPLLV